MKYIFFSHEGVGFPLAYHLQQEGHDVLIGNVLDENNILTRVEKGEETHEDDIESKRRLTLYDNILEKIPAEDLLERMEKFKNPKEFFVFFDFNYLFRYADRVKKMRFHGNFPTQRDRLFEIDRDAAKDFVHKYYPQLAIAEKKEFAKISQAERFLKNTDQIWVLKGKDWDSHTFVPDTNDPDLAKRQILEALEAFNEIYEKSGFMLEKKIPSLVEITPEKIYYDGEPLAMTINFENKPLGSGNLSLQTGCAADLVFPVDMENKIHDIAFPPVIDKMAKRRKGLFIWDASLLFNRETDEVYFGEFCPNRPGYNSFFTELSQMPSANHFFESVVKKKNPYEMGTVGASVTLFNLYRDPNDRHVLSGASVDYTPEVEKDIWLYDIYKKTKDDKMRLAGWDYHLAPVTGAGYTIDQAVNNVYKNIENFSLAGVYYRPKSDYLSLDYPTSILNRLNYAMENRLFQLPFYAKITIQPS